MADDVKWIKIKVGMFDGNSFKRIKRAKIDGVVDFRDKLTAIWFELLDLGGKVNNNGFLLNDEIAFRNYEDIAIALDRTEKEIQMCMTWYVENGMMEIVDNIFLISNWEKYQNVDGLEKLKLQNRERQARFQAKKKQMLLELNDNVSDNVDITLDNAKPLISNSKSLSKSIELKDDLKESIKIIIDYLNMKLGTHYKTSSSKTRDLIKARFNEGFKLDDFQRVIDVKVEEWSSDEKFSKFLRPETLFSNKFEGYLNQPINKKKKIKDAIRDEMAKDYEETGEFF